MGFILFVISVLCGLVFLPVGMVSGVLILLVRFNKNEGDDYFRNLALSVDQFGNVAMSPLFNLILIKEGGYKFGNPDETISSVIGKNEEVGKLNFISRGIAWILNKLDRGHTVNSIDNTEDNGRRAD